MCLLNLERLCETNTESMNTKKLFILIDFPSAIFAVSKSRCEMPVYRSQLN